MGMAALNHESHSGAYPAGVAVWPEINSQGSERLVVETGCNGFAQARSKGSWTIISLPYLEQQALYGQYDQTQGFAAKAAPKVRGRPPAGNYANSLVELDIFRCPSDPGEQDLSGSDINFDEHRGAAAQAFYRGISRRKDWSSANWWGYPVSLGNQFFSDPNGSGASDDFGENPSNVSRFHSRGIYSVSGIAGVILQLAYNPPPQKTRGNEKCSYLQHRNLFR